MKASVKAKWIRALRSRKYKQGFGQMRDKNDNFCALGVLCNIHAQEHPEIAKEQKDKTTYAGKSGSLPLIVQKWAGLDNGSVYVRPGYSIASLNDNRKLSFREIAAILEFSPV